MQAISPMNEQGILPYVGRSVCAVMHDGTCYYGTITGIDGGRLLLNGAVQGAYTLSTDASKAKTQIRKQGKAQTTAFGYPGYGGAYALSLALISLLFLVPYFWI